MQSAILPSSPKVLAMSPSVAVATQYLVYSADENHIGPVSAELIGRGVVAGKVPEDAYVAPAGTVAWAPLAAYPDIVDAMRAHKSSLRPAASFGAMTAPSPPLAPALPRDLAPPSVQPSIPLPIPNVALPPVSEPATIANALPPATQLLVGPIVAPAEAAPAVSAPAPVEAKKEEKKEEKKPALDAKWKLLPVAIFGVFGFVAVLETIIVLVARR